MAQQYKGAGESATDGQELMAGPWPESLSSDTPRIMSYHLGASGTAVTYSQEENWAGVAVFTHSTEESPESCANLRQVWGKPPRTSSCKEWGWVAGEACTIQEQTPELC